MHLDDLKMAVYAKYMESLSPDLQDLVRSSTLCVKVCVAPRGQITTLGSTSSHVREPKSMLSNSQIRPKVTFDLVDRKAQVFPNCSFGHYLAWPSSEEFGASLESKPLHQEATSREVLKSQPLPQEATLRTVKRHVTSERYCQI